MMLITGMLMLGKMSVGVRKIARTPITRMSMDITTKVYGRRNASLTIHIEVDPLLWLRYRAGTRDRRIRPGCDRPAHWWLNCAHPRRLSNTALGAYAASGSVARSRSPAQM